MNTAIWAATRQLEGKGWRTLGVRGGFTGLLRGDFATLEPSEALRFARYGGTFLGTSRDPDFDSKIPEAIASLERAGATHLLVLGGNGSLRGAASLAAAGFPVVGLPATIDNDVAGSDDSIGFDTAANFGLTMLDAFRDTLEALPRLCALETLGGDSGFLAERIGRVGGADVVLVPEIRVSSDQLEATARSGIEQRGFAVIVASEGVPNLETSLNALSERLGTRLRFSKPSHAMRGGKPSAHDRNLAFDLALAGVDALARGQTGVIAWCAGAAKRIAFDQIPARKRFERS